MEKRKKIWKETKGWLLTVVLPVSLVLMINLFVCKLAIVTGNSMYPTLYDRDLVAVWMLGAQPRQGDIVVVETDEDSYMHGERLVKRVIATGGQTVRIDYETNTVYVNGVALQEKYLNYEEPDCMLATGSAKEVTVPEGHLYVLGDNRNHSGDSRNPEIGMIPMEALVGVEIFRIPLGRWRGSGS